MGIRHKGHFIIYPTRKESPPAPNCPGLPHCSSHPGFGANSSFSSVTSESDLKGDLRHLGAPKAESSVIPWGTIIGRLR